MPFIPDKIEIAVLTVPYFEDQSEQKIPGRGTDKPVSQLQNEIRELMTKLGAYTVVFAPGTFQDEPLRYGFLITFTLANVPGRIEVAALPMKSEAPGKKDRALAQALYLVRNWLEGEVFSQIYRPNNIPLLPYLVGENDLTINEAMVKNGVVPMLSAGS